MPSLAKSGHHEIIKQRQIDCLIECQRCNRLPHQEVLSHATGLKSAISAREAKAPNTHLALEALDMVLKGTYGEKIHKTFRMTRPGVRWRVQRLFNQVYVEAFLTILLIEKTFGTQLREHAVRVSRERHAMRQDIGNRSPQTAGNTAEKTGPHRR